MTKPGSSEENYVELKLKIDAREQIAKMCECLATETPLSLEVTDGAEKTRWRDLLVTAVVRRSTYVLFVLRPAKPLN